MLDGRAPSRIRALGPSERSSKIRPGTAQTSRPRSRAWRAVTSEPERGAACTTRVPPASAAMIRLRTGKCQARGGSTPQGNSVTRAPRAAISSPEPRVALRVVDPQAAAEHGDRPPAGGGQGAAVGRGVDPAGEAGDAPPPRPRRGARANSSATSRP